MVLSDLIVKFGGTFCMENLNFENDFNWDMISDSEQNCFDYEPEYNIDDDPFAVDEETYSEKVDRLNKDYIYEDYNAIWKNLKKRHFYLDDNNAG